MADIIFDNLDFSDHTKLFKKLAGSDYDIIICNHNIEIISDENEVFHEPHEIMNDDFMAALSQTNFDTPIASLSTIAERTIVTFLLGLDDNYGKIGSLIAVHTSGKTVLSDPLRFALETIAVAIHKEYLLNTEISSMTTEITERHEELNLVYEMGRMIKKYGEQDEVFKQLVTLCATNLLVDIAVFIRKDDPKPIYHINSAEKIDNLDFVLMRLHSEIFHFIESSKEPLVMCDMNDPRREYLFSGMPFKLLAHPIQLDNKIQGILIILKNQNRPNFTNSDRNLIGVMTEQCAILLRNREMFQEVRLFTEQMAAALIESVDAKDPYTRGHSDRVNQYSMEIGQQMNLSKDDMWALNWASLLHDIGKIGVPDVVLTKPGRLTADEYTLIKIHPARGRDILQHVERLQQALPGVHFHHEKIDGTGYPDSLSGKSIPLQARIIAVADTYDAMTSSRAYRPARPYKEAMEEIRRVAGSQLDEEVVTVWEEVVRQKTEKFL